MRRLLLGLVALALTACTSSAASPSSSARGGPVNVLYAGSLVDLMQKRVGPGFEQATGYTFTGFSGGSSGLASQIKGKVHEGDVFISASRNVNDTLTGASNGDWVSWYATYATSPLVLGYDPAGSFAAALRSTPWQRVVTAPGFRLGSTDPQTDPKGALARQAMQAANLAVGTAQVYPEETLVARLQSGQLDAGFLYASEAVASHVPTVPVNQDLQASYTVTVLNRAPHEPAAEAFVRYLLGAQAQQALTQDGYQLVRPPKVTGTGIPAGLQPLLSGR